MAQLLYFAALAERLECTAEKVALPASVHDVRTLLAWLRGRGSVWDRLLADDAVNITVNRQFAAPDTRVDDRAEIAILPARRT